MVETKFHPQVLLSVAKREGMFKIGFVGYNTIPWPNGANYHVAKGDPLFKIHTFLPRDNVCGINNNIQPLQQYIKFLLYYDP